MIKKSLQLIFTLILVQSTQAFAIEECKDEIFELKACRTVKGCYKAASAGNCHAQAEMGVRYLDGNGVKVNLSLAHKWIRLSAKQGSSYGETLLGTLYANGQGVKQSDEKAVEWFEKAVEAQFSSAYTHLGVMVLAGRGAPQDDKRAFKLFQKAAEYGDCKGQRQLGFMYTEGRGTSVNVAKGQAWIEKAKATCAKDGKKMHYPNIEDATKRGLEQKEKLKQKQY